MTARFVAGSATLLLIVGSMIRVVFLSVIAIRHGFSLP
jgi:hypothetical protein